MTAIAKTDLTYTITKQKKLEDGRRMVQATIAFGDGSLTYPTNGVPLTLGKLACPVVIDSFVVIDNGASGYDISYDVVHKTMRIFQSAGLAAHTHNLLLKNAAVADGATTRVNAGANLLGANTGSDITVTGSGANGGVVAVAAGADVGQNELTTSVAPAAQTYKVVVVGY